MDFYIDSDFELLTPDAIHLATAIHFNAHEFHTFDGVNPKTPRRSKYNRSGLLLLDGNVAGHNLKIHIPSSVQYELALAPIPEPTSDTFVLTDLDNAKQESLGFVPPPEANLPESEDILRDTKKIEKH